MYETFAHLRFETGERRKSGERWMLSIESRAAGLNVVSEKAGVSETQNRMEKKLRHDPRRAVIAKRIAKPLRNVECCAP